MKIKVTSKDWLTLFFQSMRSSLKDSLANDEESFTYFKKYICANIEYGIPEDLSPKTYAEINENEELLEQSAVDLAFLRKSLPKEYKECFVKILSKLMQKIENMIEETNKVKIYEKKEINVNENACKPILNQFSKISNETDIISKKLKKCKRVFDDELRKSLGTYGTEKEDSIEKYFDNL